MPPIRELEEIRKAQIIEAALKTLTRKGIASITLDDVCKEAGLSKGGLVHYFKSKQILFKAVFEEFFRLVFEKSKEIMAQFDDPMDKLLSFPWLYDREDKDTEWGYPLLLNLMFLSAHDEKYREMMTSWIDSWVEMLGAALEQGVEDGTFTAMDTSGVARSMSAVYQGIGTRWYLAKETHSSQWAVKASNDAIKGILAPYLKS